MNTPLKTLFRAVALAGLSATLFAQSSLSDFERGRLIELADRLVAHVDELDRTTQRGAGPTMRNRVFRTQVAELENDAVAFRAALRRNRALDVDEEIARLRTSLTAVQDLIHPRRQPDAVLRTAALNTANVLAEMERITTAQGTRTGKQSARFEPGAWAKVDDIDQLATELVTHAAKMRELSERRGGSAPAIVYFEQQARTFQRVAAGRSDLDRRPRVQRLQSDLNSALREIRRQGSDEAVLSEWEWADGLLERMSAVGRLGPSNTSNRAVPDGLLGLSHDLHVQMMKAEELARAAGRGGDAFARLGDQAYAFHHEMHDGKLSYTEAQDRVETALRSYRNADVEVRRGGAPELQQQWREIAATLEKMRALMGV
jgi:hypothetical protein